MSRKAETCLSSFLSPPSYLPSGTARIRNPACPLPPLPVPYRRGSGISNLQYTQGTCRVGGITLLATPCQQVPGLNVAVPPVTWTSGLTVVGPYTCAFGTTVGANARPVPLFPVFQPLAPAPEAAMPAPGAAGAAAPPTAPPMLLLPVPPAAEIRGAPPSSPSINLDQPSPFTFGAPAPGGFQQQAGSVTPGASEAQSAVVGQGEEGSWGCTAA